MAKSGKVRARKAGRTTIRFAGFFVFAGVFIASAPLVLRAATSLDATYRITVAGVAIGAINVQSRFTDTEYAVIIKGQTVGMSRLISDAQATLLGSGRIHGKRLVPTSFDLETSEGEFETHVRMKMRAGAVTDLLAIPRLRHTPDRVPLEPKHKRDIVDPIAAFMIAIDEPGRIDGRDVCRRTVEVFDGWQRFDISLTYEDMHKARGTDKAFSGDVVVCKARYVPVAGHRMSLKSTRYMAENKRLEVWYAPIAGRNLLVPYKILIGTKFGDLIIVSTRFTVKDPSAKPAVGD